MAVDVGTLQVLLKLKDEMTPALKSADQKVSVFSSGLGKLAAMAGGMLSLSAAVAGFNKAMMAQAEAEAAVNKLNLALANQGIYTEKTSQALIEHATALQAVTTFDDETIIRGSALLASFKMNEEQIKRTTVAAADLAEGMGISFESAVNLLGRAFAGNTQMLSRYGIIVDENIPKGEKFEAVMGQLENRFGGQAQAATETYAGSMKQLSNAIGDTWESAGKLFGFLTSSGDKPFQGFISAAQSLQKVLGGSLIVAFSELKARIAESLAGIASSAERVFDVLGKLPGALGAGFRRSAEDMGLLRSSLEQSAVKFREQGDAAAKAAGNLAKVSNQAPIATQTIKDLTEATEDNAAAMEITAEQWGEAAEAANDVGYVLGDLPTTIQTVGESYGVMADDASWSFALQTDAAISWRDTAVEAANKVLANAQANLAALASSRFATEQQMADAHAAVAKAEDELDQVQAKTKMERMYMIADSASTILRTLFGKNKTAQIAAVIIDTAAAIIKSFNNGGGWPWGLIPAAAMAATGAVQLAKIKSTNASFAGGSDGFQDFGSGTPAMLHGVERVQTVSQAKAESGDVVAELRALREDMSNMDRMMERAFRNALQQAG